MILIIVYVCVSAGCRPGQWQCANGDCINVAGRCDSIPNDCDDNSDEQNCKNIIYHTVLTLNIGTDRHEQTV